MTQNEHWAQRQLRLLGRHINEEQSLLATERQAQLLLHHQHQQQRLEAAHCSRQANHLLRARQETAIRAQSDQYTLLWQALQQRQGEEEQALAHQLEWEWIRQN